MSVSSLNKLTVPIEGVTPMGTLMPKLQNRFRIGLNGFGINTDTYQYFTTQVVSAKRPSLSFEEIKLDIYNSRVNLIGKHTWEDIDITIRDDIAGNVQKLVGNQLQKQFDFYEQSAAASGMDYKFTTLIEILDGGNGSANGEGPRVLETWELLGCLLQKVDYKELGYEKSEPMTITLTIRYDNALQIEGQTTIGTTIGTGAAGVGASPINRTTGTLSSGQS